jgi:hypothetical protein
LDFEVVARCAASDCLASCELWLAGCDWLGILRGVSGRGSVRDVEDILLGVEGQGNGRAACAKRSEREQGREIAKRKYRF